MKNNSTVLAFTCMASLLSTPFEATEADYDAWWTLQKVISPDALKEIESIAHSEKINKIRGLMKEKVLDLDEVMDLKWEFAKLAGLGSEFDKLGTVGSLKIEKSDKSLTVIIEPCKMGEWFMSLYGKTDPDIQKKWFKDIYKTEECDKQGGYETFRKEFINALIQDSYNQKVLPLFISNLINNLIHDSRTFDEKGRFMNYDDALSKDRAECLEKFIEEVIETPKHLEISPLIVSISVDIMTKKPNEGAATH